MPSKILKGKGADHISIMLYGYSSRRSVSRVLWAAHTISHGDTPSLLC